MPAIRCRVPAFAALLQALCLQCVAQTNLPVPSVQVAVSNMLSRLTNDAARAAFKARLEAQFPKPVLLPLHEVTGWYTNGPAVFFNVRLAITNHNNNPVFAELHRLGYPTPPLTTLEYYTNSTFHHFLPESLNNVCWTNFMAHTNSRTTQIWSARTHLPGWPAKPPILRWNTNCLMWGMKGLTALSPCWQAEGLPGQMPITALTRRHGYTRGHGVGADGFQDLWAGAKVWFLTLDNQVVERTIVRDVVRTIAGSGRDYTLVLFNEDLPDSITPIRVVAARTLPVKYPTPLDAPWPMFLTEQTGNVSAEFPGFSVPTMKGGDSGSPNMLPLPGELAFSGGRTTSAATAEMQADMDQLCRLSRLDPSRYQMQWVDLASFPSY